MGRMEGDEVIEFGLSRIQVAEKKLLLQDVDRFHQAGQSSISLSGKAQRVKLVSQARNLFVLNLCNLCPASAQVREVLCDMNWKII